MATKLDFAEEFHYPDEPSGITIPTLLTYGNKTIRASAKVDTGADVCLFAREIGVRLGLRVEEGDAISLSSLAGSLEAFGHEVVIQTGALVFQSRIYFAKHPGLPRNILGRQGWLRNLRIAIIDYDRMLYSSEYDS